jgi:2-methylisocitrate lyase-like PEP mutase family enzyme
LSIEGAIDEAGGDTLLVGRAECFLVGRPDLKETIGRLRAYSQAGARNALRRRSGLAKGKSVAARRTEN